MISWYAVHAQPNGEEKARANLERQGYDVFLPRYRRWVRHARQRRIVSRPLFPRYLFVGLDRAEMRWRPILSTPGVASLVRAGDEPAAVATGVIKALRGQDREGAFDRVVPAEDFCPGDKVRIKEGPFQDLVGRLIRGTGDGRVCILLELLGREVRAEVSGLMIEAA